jgi:hypothetical protein
LESIATTNFMTLRNTPVFVIKLPRAASTNLLQETLGTIFVAENGSVCNCLPMTIAASAIQTLDLKAVHALDVYFDYLKVSHLFAPGLFCVDRITAQFLSSWLIFFIQPTNGTLRPKSADHQRCLGLQVLLGNPVMPWKALGPQAVYARLSPMVLRAQRDSLEVRSLPAHAYP